jgi:hypothetical protein
MTRNHLIIGFCIAVMFVLVILVVWFIIVPSVIESVSVLR